MSYEQILILIITSIISGIGATWAYFSKVVVPKIVDANLEEKKRAQNRLDTMSSTAAQMDQILVNAGIASAKDERLAQLGQIEQILTLLHDDQQFIRDTMSKLLGDMTQLLRQIQLANQRQNDLLTAFNVDLQAFKDELRDDYFRKEGYKATDSE